MDDTRHRLINAAGYLFAEKGFESASVREICQRAEANIAAVNYHFGDKQKLYIEAVKQAQCARVEEVPALDLPPGVPSTDRLRLFIRLMLERMLHQERPAWHLELMLRELARPTAACQEVVDAYIRPMADQLRSIVVELVPNHPPERLNLIGFSIVGQVLFYYVNRPIIRLLIGDEAHQALTIEQLASHIARFSLAALGMAPPVQDRAAEDLSTGEQS